MSVFGLPYGIPNTERKTLSGTSATTILSAGDKKLVIVGILLVNASGGALTPIVDLYDGSTAFPIRDNASLSDNTAENVAIPSFIRMKPSDVLRVTSASGLTVHVSYLDLTTSNKA